MSSISEGHSIRSWFSRKQKNSSSRLVENKADRLIFQCKIEQITEKAAIKLLIKFFTEELLFRELITNEL